MIPPPGGHISGNQSIFHRRISPPATGNKFDSVENSGKSHERNHKQWTLREQGEGPGPVEKGSPRARQGARAGETPRKGVPGGGAIDTGRKPMRSGAIRRASFYFCRRATSKKRKTCRTPRHKIKASVFRKFSCE